MGETLTSEAESQILELIYGNPDCNRRRQTLDLISHDEQARQYLRETLELQGAARTAAGTQFADELVSYNLPGLQLALSDKVKRADEPVSGQASRYWRPMMLWSWRAAACLLIGVSLYLAATAHRKVEGMREQVPAFPTVSQSELASYRQVWGQLADRTMSAAPWVLISDGRGEFGYLPVEPREASGGTFVLLRCFVVSTDGGIMDKMVMVLPVGKDMNLRLPTSGRLAGQPVRYEVASTAQQAWLSVSAGQEPSTASGIRGSVSVGQEPTEIGQFQLSGKNMRVFVQVVPFQGSIG